MCNYSFIGFSFHFVLEDFGEEDNLFSSNFIASCIVSSHLLHQHNTIMNFHQKKNSFNNCVLYYCSIFLLKNLVAWYFQRKVNSNSEQLAELRAEKRQLLDQVKTKETYKDAVEILQRFGGASDKSFTSPSAITTTPIRSNSPSNSMNNTKMMVNTSTNMTPSMAAFKTPAARQLVQVNQNISALQQRMNSQTTPFDGNRALMIAPSSVSAIRSSKRTPYPIIDSTQKSVVDKMVDYLIGDGPSNRFAMICQQCFKHNGN